jgi:aspartate aminotransferase
MVIWRFAVPTCALAVALIIGTGEAFAIQTSRHNTNQQERMSSVPTKRKATVEDATTATTLDLEGIPQGPPDAILGIAEAFKASTSPNKVNVCVGAYRDEVGKPWVLPSVVEAEQRMMQLYGKTQTKEYASIAGDADFVQLALKFAFGTENASVLDRLAGVQSLSGTGACRIGGQFLAKFMPVGTPIYIPNPTWGNHIAIFKECGLDVQRYRYYDRRTNALDFDGLMEDLDQAPAGSIVLLHACAHNPTGCDPTMDQWKAISDLCKNKGHVVFFDSAYQGFASGDSEKDAQALRYFVSPDGGGHSSNVLLAQSFAKNFGLYGERCGTLSVLCDSTDQRNRIMSQLKCIIRPMYSSPPIHGSSIVKTILSDEALTAQYYKECAHMAHRIAAMRQKLVTTLKDVGSVHDWSHVSDQIGMFAFTGMSSDMVDRMTAEYEIYLTRDGRISLAGLNDNNVEYVAKALHDVTHGKNIVSE